MYRDGDIGIDEENSRQVIELRVDEDCESSMSVIRYGVKLCEEDLRDGVRKRRGSDSDWE